MAARLKGYHAEEVRAKIKASQLINRLQNFGLGKNGVKLDTAEVNAIKILLGKCLADLANVQVTGDGGGPVKMTIEWAKPDA